MMWIVLLLKRKLPAAANELSDREVHWSGLVAGVPIPVTDWWVHPPERLVWCLASSLRSWQSSDDPYTFSQPLCCSNAAMLSRVPTGKMAEKRASLGGESGDSAPTVEARKPNMSRNTQGSMVLICAATRLPAESGGGARVQHRAATSGISTVKANRRGLLRWVWPLRMVARAVQ